MKTLALASILIALTIFQQAPSPIPRSPQPSISKQEGTDPNDQKATQNQEGASQPSAGSKANPAPNPANQNSGNIDARNKDNSVRVISLPPVTTVRDIPTFVISAVLAVAGIVGILIGICTLKIIGRQTVAIEKQAEAMMDADCALFLILWENMIHCSPEAPNGTLSHALRWSFQNVGKSPGFLTSAFARFIVVESLEKIPPIPDYTIPKDLKLAHDSEPILAGEKHQPGLFAPIESTLSFEELEALQRSGKCYFYAYGRVCYIDIYGRDQESRFGIAWEYLPDRPVRGRFKIDGPRAYNGYKNRKNKN
jgi:hypothetical protein